MFQAGPACQDNRTPTDALVTGAAVSLVTSRTSRAPHRSNQRGNSTEPPSSSPARLPISHLISRPFRSPFPPYSLEGIQVHPLSLCGQTNRLQTKHSSPVRSRPASTRPTTPHICKSYMYLKTNKNKTEF